MKKIIFILAALFISLQSSDLTANSFSPADKLVSTQSATELNCQDITNYLVSRGYTVYSVWHIMGTANFGAYTMRKGINYETTVYTNYYSIFGNEDMPI